MYIIMIGYGRICIRTCSAKMSPCIRRLYRRIYKGEPIWCEIFYSGIRDVSLYTNRVNLFHDMVQVLRWDMIIYGENLVTWVFAILYSLQTHASTLKLIARVFRKKRCPD